MPTYSLHFYKEIDGFMIIIYTICRMEKDLKRDRNILKVGWDTPEYTPVERGVTNVV
jgi:hypothetical protein